MSGRAYNRTLARRGRENKAALVRLMGGRCLDCGLGATEERFALFHFHHLEEKKFNLGQRMNGLDWGWDALVEEARKCVLLCRDCHFSRHARGRPATGPEPRQPLEGWAAWLSSFPDFEGLRDMEVE